jgi:xanthine dehydrogenase accessory factor
MEGFGVLEEMGELARRGETFALATVVWRQGPSSSQSGSRAIITAGGELHGWIGGACAEPVVIREAQRVMASGTAKLLLLGTPEQFGAAVPDGMTVIPISCQSEGAIEVYIEPVLPTPHLVVVGVSPMAHTLASLARALGWRTELTGGPDFATAGADERSMIVVATQGHDDEDVLERAVAARPAYLAELVQLRASGALVRPAAEPVTRSAGSKGSRETRGEPGAGGDPRTNPGRPTQAVDPVCGMTVAAEASGRPVRHEDVDYYFCCAGCRRAFEQDPDAYVKRETRC